MSGVINFRKIVNGDCSECVECEMCGLGYIDDLGYYAEHYNCGGFAFGTRDWYMPNGWEDRYYDFDWDPTEEEELQRYTESMLDEIFGLRLIYSEKELKPHEFLVLFRIGPDDFHFVRKENGRYYHKRGWYHEIEEIEEDEVYGPDWVDGKYDSDIVMFAYDDSLNVAAGKKIAV